MAGNTSPIKVWPNSCAGPNLVNLQRNTKHPVREDETHFSASPLHLAFARARIKPQPLESCLGPRRLKFPIFAPVLAKNSKFFWAQEESLSACFGNSRGTSSFRDNTPGLPRFTKSFTAPKKLSIPAKWQIGSSDAAAKTPSPDFTLLRSELPRRSKFDPRGFVPDSGQPVSRLPTMMPNLALMLRNHSGWRWSNQGTADCLQIEPMALAA